MTKFSFSLLTGETGPLVKANTPDRLSIPIHSHTPTLSVGDQVLSGTQIATANRPGEGNLHSPLAGVIKSMFQGNMVIEVTGEERAERHKSASKSGTPLKEWLRSLGVNVKNINQAASLVINAVPPEPGISIYEPLLRDYRQTVELGLETVQQIVNPSKMYLATAKGNRTSAFPNCSVVDIPPVHPNGMDQMVLKAVTGQEVLIGASPDNVALLSVKELYLIGRVMETGRPVTETVMTIGNRNHLVHIGTPVGFLIAEAGGTVQPGNRVILGGLLRGLSALNLQHGVDKETTGLNIVATSENELVTDNPCVGCGECERHCPARIMPGMISRCSEFKHFDRAEDFHIHSCFECGICGYWCIAQRPLLHYIRLAKYELALLRSATSTINADNQSSNDEQSGESA